jgi:hypothetical protein
MSVRRTRPRLSALVVVLIACCLVAPFAAPAAPAHAAGTTYYVQDGASGTTCDSWANACDSLQAALDLASSGDEIRVAAGTYYPDEGGGQTDNDRNATFQLVDGIAIYGGYPTGGGTRDWEANPTILSGDIDGNDTNTDGNNINETWNDIQGSNAYNVVTGANNATLDGFTITAGNANGGSFPNRTGGGMFNDSSSPTLTNVTISGNQANHGGGMFNHYFSSPTLTNVTIAGNQAIQGGGGMYNVDSSSPVLTNVTISGNRATSGGGMFNHYFSSPTLTNVTISGNRATSGGGMFNNSSSPVLTNVTISGNQAIQGGGGMYNNSSSPVLTNVTISGNQAIQGGGGMFNNSSSPTIQNSIIWGNTGPQVSGFPSYANTLVQGENTGGFNGAENPLFAAPEAASSAPTTAGDYRLLPGSPAIDVGNNTADLDAGGSGTDTINDIAADLDGTPRIVGGTVDLGAYEAPEFTLTAESGNNQRTLPGSAFSNPLVVSVAVSDTATYPSYPLEGGSVTFAGPGTGASTDPQTNIVIIDSSDQASASVSANNTAGSYTVSASTSGSADTVDFSLTNLTEVVSITRADSSPTNAASVAFTVVFSDSVTGVNTGNFSLSTSGTSGNIDSVTGSGDTWTVTVGNITGDGDLGLDMVNDTGVDPGVGNLPFTSEAYTIDTTPPTAPTVSGSTPTSDTMPTWNWTARSGGNGTFRYKLDDSDLSSGATDTTTTSYTPASALADGSHTLYVQDRDGVGNWSASGTFTVLVDTTPPTVSIGNAPADPSGSSEASISFSGDDGTGSGIAGYACQLDGGTFEPCSSPLEYSGLEDGEHTVTVRATDNVGNTSTPASHTWTVDSTLPAVSIDSAPPDLTSSTEATVSFSASDSDGIASLECQFNEGAWEACSSPVSYTGLSDGEHTVTVRATDNVGNSSSASHTWTVDTTPPTVTIDSAPADPSGSTEATVSFSGDDGTGSGIAGYECQLDGGTWEACSSPVSYTGLSDGEHTVTVRATDNAGNSSPPASHTWTVDTTAPAEVSSVYLPLVIQSGTSLQPAEGTPDLVGTITLAPDQRSFAAGEPVNITVEVTNQGEAATDSGFWVDLYINPTQMPTINQPWDRLCGLYPCYGIVWGVSEPLQPGESVTLTSTAGSYAAEHTIWPGWFAAGTSDLYLLVDSWNCDETGAQCAVAGVLPEGDETNNLTYLNGLTVTGDNPPQTTTHVVELPVRPPQPGKGE